MYSNSLYNTHNAHTHLNCLHPAGLFDLVVDDRSVLTDRFIPSSQTDGVLGKKEGERNTCDIELKDFMFVCVYENACMGIYMSL